VFWVVHGRRVGLSAIARKGPTLGVGQLVLQDRHGQVRDLGATDQACVGLALVHAASDRVGREGETMIIRMAVAIVAALATSTASLAEPLTLCGQKVSYQPAATVPSNAGNLVGIWVGEILAFNAAYSVDYSRCWALVIEDVSVNSGIKAQIVLADNTKNMHNGTRYGTQGYVLPSVGQLDPSGATLRFTSTDGRTSYELRPSAAKMEGKVTYASGTGRLFLVKQ
jgi:hypothetical protein